MTPVTVSAPPVVVVNQVSLLPPAKVKDPPPYPGVTIIPTAPASLPPFASLTTGAGHEATGGQPPARINAYPVALLVLEVSGEIAV
jgi:hypothetical protein